MNILELVTTTRDECNKLQDNGHCVSKDTIDVIGDFAGDHERAMETAQKKTGCDSEYCVLSSSKFVDFVKSKTNPGLEWKIQEEIIRNFKMTGPKYSRGLLSNFHIDGTLQQWAEHYPKFFNCPYGTIDFEQYNTALAKIDMRKVFRGQHEQVLSTGKVARECDTFGCVLNTDSLTGPGKHWTCIFVDMRGDTWTVEYFNSSGKPPPKEWADWLYKTKDSLEEIKDKVAVIPGSSIVHQQSKTECGLYTLFYIRARLDNVPYHFFSSRQVPDKFMEEFRAHIFR